MITIKQFLEAGKWKITGGAEYQWTQFGHNARYIDCDLSGTSCMNCVYDTVTQEIYVAELYHNDKAYRLVNPAYKQLLIDEHERRGVPYLQGTDTSDIIDLEVGEDFLEKATAVFNGEEFDTRVQVPLTLPDDELFKLMRLAHEQDITLNKMVEKLLRLAIEKEKANG